MCFVVCLPLTPNGSGCPSGSASWAPCPCTPLAFRLGSPPLSPAPRPPGRLCSCSGTQPLSCPDVGTPTPLFPLAVPVTPSSSCTPIASLSFPLACELLEGRDCALWGLRLSKAQDDLVSIRFSGLIWCPSAPDCHRGHLLMHSALPPLQGPGPSCHLPGGGRGQPLSCLCSAHSCTFPGLTSERGLLPLCGRFHGTLSCSSLSPGRV